MRQHPRSTATVALCVTTLALTVALALAAGGFSHDPAVNLAVGDGPGDQIMAKVAQGARGFFVSWYDNATGGYDLRLQRLDARGDELWPHKGVLVADTSFSWVTDYSLAAGVWDNALMAFRDDRFGEPRVTVARVAPDGTLPWGVNGIQLSQGTEFVGPPKVAAATDGNLVVAWTEGQVLKLRRLSMEGTALWPRDVEVVDPAGATNNLADLHAVTNGGVIVSWVRQGDFSAPRHLLAQRFTAAGEPVWGALDAAGLRQPLVIFDGGTLQYGNFPPFTPARGGGAVFGWYETTPRLQVRVQHVRPDGSLVFPADGALAADPSDAVERVEPVVTYDGVTEEIYAFWRERPSAGGVFSQAIYGQRFAVDGARLWGDSGKVIVPYEPNELLDLHALPQPSAADPFAADLLLCWVETGAPARDQRIWIRRLSPDGTDAWPKAPVAVSSAASTKSRLAQQADPAGGVVLAWHDNRAGNEDVFLQNVMGDGSLGRDEVPPTPAATLHLPWLARSAERPRPPR